MDALIVLSDQMALAYAARLSSEGAPVIGIPKSVHNDIPGTSYSLGISTAIATDPPLIVGDEPNGWTPLGGNLL